MHAGASLYVRFRRGQPYKGEAPLTWHINCEKGEIRLTSTAGAALQVGGDGISVEVHDFEKDEIHSVPWAWPDWQDGKDYPPPSRNIASVYDGFAANAGGYPTFEDALRRHEQLGAIISGWSASA